MRVVSYYAQSSVGDHWTFWTDGIGIALPKAIGDATLVPLPRGVTTYDVDGDYDIAYCHMWAVPKKKPAKFVYAFLSDYIGNETKVKEWLEAVQPDLLCCLQTCPEDLVEFGEKIGCRVVFLPWFVVKVPSYQEKTILAMCSGCIGSIYPSRTQIFNYLVAMNREDFVLSCSNKFGDYPLSNEKYRESLAVTKYYFSGGIYDRFIPPKYYEVCACGACLVSFRMPHMQELGFIDGETYLELPYLGDIRKILQTDQWRPIGRTAQEMIRERHTVEKRAEQIRALAKELQSVCG